MYKLYMNFHFLSWVLGLYVWKSSLIFRNKHITYSSNIHQYEYQYIHQWIFKYIYKNITFRWEHKTFLCNEKEITVFSQYLKLFFHLSISYLFASSLSCKNSCGSSYGSCFVPKFSSRPRGIKSVKFISHWCK